MIGVASLFSGIMPCNAHLDRLARKGCEGIRAGGVPQIFGAPTSGAGGLREAFLDHIQGIADLIVGQAEPLGQLLLADALSGLAGKLRFGKQLIPGGVFPVLVELPQLLQTTPVPSGVPPLRSAPPGAFLLWIWEKSPG